MSEWNLCKINIKTSAIYFAEHTSVILEGMKSSYQTLDQLIKVDIFNAVILRHLPDKFLNTAVYVSHDYKEMWMATIKLLNHLSYEIWGMYAFLYSIIVFFLYEIIN